MKRWILSLLLLSVFFVGDFTMVQADEGMSLEETIIAESSKPVTFSYDLNQKLSDVKSRLDFLIDQNFGITPDKTSSEYLDILNKISLDPSFLNVTESDKNAFSAFSTVYIGRIASFIHENMSEDEKNSVTEMEINLLNKTFLDIRNENIQTAKAVNDVKQHVRRKRNVSNFYEPAATAYALKYALDGNGAYIFIFKKDCTNFASQIMEAGGMIQSYQSNGSGYSWYYSNALAHSKSWTWAHGFMQYWTAEGARTQTFTSTSSAVPYIRKGNFIGYWNKSTFEFGHMAYVNNVSNGKVYICQHTTNRRNDLWNNIDWKSEYSSITILSVG